MIAIGRWPCVRRAARELCVLLTVLAGCLITSERLNAGEDGGTPARIPASGLGRSHVLVGMLHRPLGTVVRVEGVVIEGRPKGPDSGPRILVQKIDGRATQETIVLPLFPYHGRFGSSMPPTTPVGDDAATQPAIGLQLPKLRMSETFELEGYETGGYIGVPRAAYERAGLLLQTTGFGFYHRFLIYWGKQTKAVGFSPADFLAQEALIEGRADSRKKKAYIIGEGWQLLVDDSAPWPAHCEGKRTESLGVICRGDEPNEYRLESGWKRLSRLEDQVGRDVLLRGTVRCWMGEYWLIYRGTTAHVENVEKLAGFSVRTCCEKPVAVRGRLDQAMLPNPERRGRAGAKEKIIRFVVREATIEPIDPLLSPETLQQGMETGRP